jgi:hypothetical protein
MKADDLPNEPTAFLPVVRVPRSMLPPAPWYGGAKLKRRNGETLVACLDMTGMIYGVVVPLSFAGKQHPADFDSGEIVACRILNERWQRFLMSNWCLRWWRRQVI